MHVISAHLSTESLERHLHVGDVVLGLLQKLQFSSQRYLLAIPEPVSDDRFTSVYPADAKDAIMYYCYEKITASAVCLFFVELHGTGQSVPSRDRTVVVVNDQTLAEQTVRA